MESPTNADLDMIEALLATMQQNNQGQIYDEVDEDEDDDYEDDDEDDDDDDGYYGGEQNIHTLLNPYGGGEGGDMGAGEGQMMPNAQTMNFLQGLLSMNNSSISGMAEIEAAIGGSMGGAIGGMGGSMDDAAGGFLPTMQSILPNMDTNMAGALAGAFAGGMGSLMEYGGHDPNNHEEYDDDDDEDEDDDDDVLSDEEDEDDDEDDDDEDHHHHHHIKHGIDPSSLVMGGVGGLMAAGLLANASNVGMVNSPPRNYPHNLHLPALMAPPTGSSAMPMMQHHPQTTMPAIGFCPPNPMHMAPQSAGMPAIASAPTPPPTSITATSVGSMSGGTVSKADPLAALMAGIGGAAVGAGILAPIVSNLLGNSGGTTVVNKLNSSNSSSTTVIANKDSFNSSSRTLPDTDYVDGTAAAAAAKTNTPNNPTQLPPNSKVAQSNTNAPANKSQILESRSKIENCKNGRPTKECDDDKASLGSASSSGSETSGCGKSDTESVGKKTPSPVPEAAESTNSQKEGSCASIPDLASATESMRDSDTDNHSEGHNVTANLSDVDNDEQQKTIPVNNQYAVGLPVVVEYPTYGWGSMIGLDKPKTNLHRLFGVGSFPAVFEGTEGTCKGILLFGPSGSGKTCLARALAKEATNALFVGISSRYLLNDNHEARKLVRLMFEQARRGKPAVILFDEIELLSYPPISEATNGACGAKEEILAQVRGFTTLHPAYAQRPEQSSLNDGILVLSTTNQPWLVEDRLRKLFAYSIHVKLPDDKARHQLFRMYLQNLPHNIDEEEFQCLVSKSDGYSAADINTVIRQANHRVPLEPSNESGHRLLSFDDLATIMTQYRCRFDEDLKTKYDTYVSTYTQKEESPKDNSRGKKDKPKGIKKFKQITKSFAASLLAVID